VKKTKPIDLKEGGRGLCLTCGVAGPISKLDTRSPTAPISSPTIMSLSHTLVTVFGIVLGYWVVPGSAWVHRRAYTPLAQASKQRLEGEEGSEGKNVGIAVPFDGGIPPHNSLIYLPSFSGWTEWTRITSWCAREQDATTLGFAQTYRFGLNSRALFLACAHFRRSKAVDSTPRLLRVHLSCMPKRALSLSVLAFSAIALFLL